MEKYRKKVILRVIALSFLALFALSIDLVDVFGAQEQLKENVVLCFQCGLAIAIELLSIIQIIKYSKALKNDGELEKIYNQENDERMRAIRAKAGQPLLLIISIIMLLAGIVIGYFNHTVFYTLIGAVAFQSLVSVIVKFAYMKKM